MSAMGRTQTFSLDVQNGWKEEISGHKLCARSAEDCRDMRLSVCAIGLLLSAGALATSPARWIQERANCLTSQTDHARAREGYGLNASQARSVAKRVVLACGSTIPHDFFTAQERANIEGADRFDIARKLRSTAPTQVR